MTATPFSTLLIANRGEIARRIARTARRMGLRTVAVYSSADAEALHVREADRAVAIGGARPGESYLNIDAILDAAVRSGADAVHPGYGFLAENAAFARACRAAGLVFVGPSADAIEAMGDKAGAKRLVRAAGVPCIRGVEGAGLDDGQLAAQAAALGYPLMIKASAGGGGRGMRRVERSADFAAALRTARSEARAAFGDDGVIIERALDGARHVEVQVFADRDGRAVHLGERDCSVQRRHQKLIEEAPSPAVDAALRARLGATALDVVRAVPYEGAGTVEFLLDAQGRHWFMEMNTRLQVEHPVTEAVTGLDLVEWQLRVAMGEPLPLGQDDIRFDGHAIEVRVCAEDPVHGHLPQAGRVVAWQPPAGVRVEHALEDGIEIAPWYDSMMAKVVAHAHDRDGARRSLAGALDELVAFGPATNRAFLARCLRDPVFAAGEATTAFVDEHGAALAAVDAPARETLLRLAGLAWLQPATGAQPHPLAHRLPVPTRLAVGDEVYALEATRLDEHRVVVTVGGRPEVLELVDAGPRAFAWRTEGGVLERAAWARDGDLLWVQHAGSELRVEDRTRRALRRADAEAGGEVRASMAGRIVAVLAKAGDRVETGAPLVTLEAMKMEHVHAAPRAGVLQSIAVVPGEQVAGGRVLAVIA
ncbi:MAG TPA: biotin carboxylase N-terminal domain-containing protein [Caldimonas sp.]|nr:biotin carboxylase N-terminal domain-containing protein [Caldimonas sp.]